MSRRRSPGGRRRGLRRALGWAAGPGPALCPRHPRTLPACREHNRTNWSIVLQDIYQPPNLLQNSKPGLLSLGRKYARYTHSRTRTNMAGGKGRRRKEGECSGEEDWRQVSAPQGRSVPFQASPPPLPALSLPASAARGVSFHLGDSSSDATGTWAAVAEPRTAVGHHCPQDGGPRGKAGAPGREFCWKGASARRQWQRSGHPGPAVPPALGSASHCSDARFFPLKSCRNKTKTIKVPLKRSSFSRNRCRLLAGARGAGPSFYSFLIFSGSL